MIPRVWEYNSLTIEAPDGLPIVQVAAQTIENLNRLGGYPHSWELVSMNLTLVKGRVVWIAWLKRPGQDGGSAIGPEY